MCVPKEKGDAGIYSRMVCYMIILAWCNQANMISHAVALSAMMSFVLSLPLVVG